MDIVQISLLYYIRPTSRIIYSSIIYMKWFVYNCLFASSIKLKVFHIYFWQCPIYYKQPLLHKFRKKMAVIKLLFPLSKACKARHVWSCICRLTRSNSEHTTFVEFITINSFWVWLFESQHAQFDSCAEYNSYLPPDHNQINESLIGWISISIIYIINKHECTNWTTIPCILFVHVHVVCGSYSFLHGRFRMTSFHLIEIFWWWIATNFVYLICCNALRN